ncbi:unnamed protein product [Pseudo-nitzschia multistriata]|uniref:Uncharacterized protein n=1 Tax=Pseudo-nitzschia multistriata TaxID=183589 RepID=A0A448ZBG1_9STRA|nr:unnamed protein product [Pseudo-nitzschia multistriata]
MMFGKSTLVLAALVAGARSDWSATNWQANVDKAMDMASAYQSINWEDGNWQGNSQKAQEIAMSWKANNETDDELLEVSDEILELLKNTTDEEEDETVPSSAPAFGTVAAAVSTALLATTLASL